jgi:hypothetical protein
VVAEGMWLEVYDIGVTRLPQARIIFIDWFNVKSRGVAYDFMAVWRPVYRIKNDVHK